MSHPLNVTVGESKIVERAFSAAGVTCYIRYNDPHDAGRVTIKHMTGRKGVGYPWMTLTLDENRYTDKNGAFQPTHLPVNGVDALLQALRWFYTEIYSGGVADIVVAATRQAINTHTLIAYADSVEDSIDSGDAIDRCYDAVRVVLPEYTTSADIEPPRQGEAT